MPKYKPTRTDDNLPSRSTPIRKGKMSEEQIEATAQELTRLQVVEAPAIETDYLKPGKHNHPLLGEYTLQSIEPVVKGDYKVYAEDLKAMIIEYNTVEIKAEDLAKTFPQARRAGDVARNLSKTHGLSYRRVENGRNDTYVFFVEPTREELTVMLTSAESKVIELRSTNKELYKECNDLINLYEEREKKLEQENTQLKSDLSNSQKTNKILFVFAIGAVITILFKSVAL